MLQPFQIEPINPFAAELKLISQALSAQGRGVLDLGDGPEAVAARLRSAGSDGSIDEIREWLRFLCCSEKLAEGFSGVVLPGNMFGEGKGTSSARQLVKDLSAKGIAVGVRVDTGFSPLNGYGEKGTEGLIGLRERCEAAYALGARFAHWRTSVTCGMELPTDISVWESTDRMAKCAATCQQHGLVPAIELDVVPADGPLSVERSAYVSEKVYHLALRSLAEREVTVEAVAMIVSPCVGGPGAAPIRPDDVAEFTARSLWRAMPPAVPCLQILARRLSLSEAARLFMATRESLPTGAPWCLSFAVGCDSLGRVLEEWVEGRSEDSPPEGTSPEQAASASWGDIILLAARLAEAATASADAGR